MCSLDSRSLKACTRSCRRLATDCAPILVVVEDEVVVEEEEEVPAFNVEYAETEADADAAEAVTRAPSLVTSTLLLSNRAELDDNR